MVVCCWNSRYIRRAILNRPAEALWLLQHKAWWEGFSLEKTPHVVVLSSPLNGGLLLEQQVHPAGNLEQACRSTLVVAGKGLVRGISFEVPHVIVHISPLDRCLLLEQQVHPAVNLGQACRSTLVVAGRGLVGGILVREGTPHIAVVVFDSLLNHCQL